MFMMNNAIFTEEMLTVLAEMKGKTFKSYECVKMGTSMTYGKCRLNLGTFSIDLYNYVHTMPFFGAVEDIPYFSCERMDKNSEYVTCEKNSIPHVYMIDEKIQSVEIVNDEINVNHGEYQITIDQALIIKTKDNVYSFYKDWMYSEVINIAVDRSDETVYPEEKVYNEWSDNGSDYTEIKRTRKVL